LKKIIKKRNIPEYSLLSFTIFFDLEEIVFENFNIFENNIISVELAKVLVGYFEDFNAFSYPCIIPLNDRQSKSIGPSKEGRNFMKIHP